MDKPKQKRGLIKGKGTGTSDDIQMPVEKGGYIMPADSTAQLGIGNLKKTVGQDGVMPKAGQFDAMVSNGEYQLSPDDVHQVGVQTLDQMKNATHTPVPEENNKPELFFANGGELLNNAISSIPTPKAVDDFSNDVGGYWSRDNAQFEASNPNVMQRIGRAVNPLTGLGSAAGMMYDAAGTGDGIGMGLAAASAVPAFGVGKLVKNLAPATPIANPLAQAATKMAPNMGKTGGSVATNTAVNVGADMREIPKFANGGELLDDDVKLARNMKNVTPQQPRIGGPATAPKPAGLPATTTSAPMTNPTAAAGGIRGFAGKVARGGAPVAGISGAAAGLDTSTEDYRARIGMAPWNPNNNEAVEWGKEGLARTLGVLSDVGNAALFNQASRNFADVNMRENAQRQAAQQAQAQPAQPTGLQAGQEIEVNPNYKPPVQSLAERAGQQPSFGIGQSSINSIDKATGNTQQAAPQAAQQSGINFGVPKGSPADNPYGPNPIGKAMSDPRAAMQAMNNMRAMSGGLGNYNAPSAPAHPMQSPMQQEERRQLINKASTAMRGAQNGQLTANQLNVLAGIQRDENSLANQRYTTDANNAAQAQQTAMREMGADARTAMNESGQNTRFDAGLNRDYWKDGQEMGLRNRQQDLTERKEGIGIRLGETIEKLRNDYASETDENKRAAIGQMLASYTGDGAKTPQGASRYVTVKGSKGSDAQGGEWENPSMLMDTVTGQIIVPEEQLGIQGRGKQGAQDLPKMGETFKDPKTGKMQRWNGTGWDEVK